jgi:hypothetical protein
MSENVKIVLAVALFVLWAAVNFVLKPDRFAPVSDEAVPLEATIDGNEKEVLALLAWEQSGVKISGIWLFPTSRQLVLYSAEHQIKWSLKEEIRVQTEAEFADQHPMPRWRYFLGTLSVAAAALLVVLFLLFDALLVDRKAWGKAKRKDTFGSYKDYLVEKRKLKLTAGTARKRMMARVGQYRTFYGFLTANSEGDARDALLEILRHIGRTGDLEVGVSFEFDNALKEHASLIEEELAKVQKLLGAGDAVPMDVRAKVAEQKVQLEGQRAARFAPVVPCYSRKHNTSREKLLTNLLDRVFSRIFPERILVLDYRAKKDAQIRISYRVSNTGTIFTRRGTESLPPDKRTAYCGVQFDWDIELMLGGRRLLRRTLRSQPASTFQTASDDHTGVYKSMAMSGFVDMGKALLKELGVAATVEMPAMAGNSQRLKEELFGQFLEMSGGAAEGLLERIDPAQAQAFYDSHAQDIGAMMSGLAVDLDRMMSLYTQGLAKGVELGDLAFEVITTLLEE